MTDAFRTIEISNAQYECDGLRHVTVMSQNLGGRGDVSVWAPQVDRIDTLLILLHGVYGSHWVWSLKGGVHHTAQRMIDTDEISPIAIAMPSDGLLVEGSGYLAWQSGIDVERWIVEDVPAVARLAVPGLGPDAAIAIGGLSMGGYAAMRIGAKYPDCFASISGHSSFTTIEEIGTFVNEPVERYLQCGSHEELSVSYWLQRHRSRLPPLRFDCGVDDALLITNRNLHAHLESLEIEHEYAEYPGGHEWSYWQSHVAETLRHADRQGHKRTSNETA